MNGQMVCVVGSSAGGLRTLQTLTAGLPRGFPAAMFIVQHCPIDQPSLLPTILGAKCALPTSHAVDGAPVRSGHVYIAPPNRHLVLEGESMRLKCGPRINFVRPAIDPLFRSAAQQYGNRAVGIILSGRLDDGAAGLMAIQRRGGKVIVQRPDEAAVPEMPENALRNTKADFVLDVSEMPEVLMKILSEQESGSPPQSTDEIDGIRNVIADNRSQQEREGRKGQIVPFTCTECGGPLWQVDEPGMATFACHVGHVLNGQTLLEGQSDYAERTMWTTMRLLKDIQLLANQLARNARDLGLLKEASDFESKSRFAARQLEAYEKMLLTPVDPV